MFAVMRRIGIVILLSLVLPACGGGGSDDNSVGDAPTNDSPSGDAPSGDAPSGDAPSGDAPSGDAPADEAPSGDAPSGEAPSGDAPADEAPADEVPADEAPADEAPADEAPADEAPADEAPADEAPADEAPADETPADEAEVEPVVTNVLAINFGGEQFTSSDNITYMRDDGRYVTDSLKAMPFSTPVDGTDDDQLYQTERFARDGQTFFVRIPIENGKYRVTMLFGEVYFESADTRVFDVQLEGEYVIRDLDLYALNNQTFFAVNHVFDDLSVEDGQLDIQLDSVRENAQISAIRIDRITTGDDAANNGGDAGDNNAGNGDNNAGNGNGDPQDENNNPADENDNPPANTAGSITTGKTLYDEHCIICHGADGTSATFDEPGKDAIIIPLDGSYAHSLDPDVQLDLDTYNALWMPNQGPTACGEDCAKDIGAYLLFLDENNSPSQASLACEASEVGYGRRQMRLLQISEYENSVLDLTGVEVDAAAAGVPSDTFVEGFANQVLTAVSQDYADAYALLATQIAEASASDNFANIVNCDGVSGSQCATRFVDEFAYKVFRRPLTTDEREGYIALFDSAVSENNNEGLQLAVEAIFGSPYFLLRSEAGVQVSDIQNPTAEQQSLDNDAYVLTPYEIATFLSYTYTGSTPDNALLQAAQNGSLNNAPGIRSQIDRLLLSDKARKHFGEFAEQWLETDRVISVNKDNNAFPTFTAEVRSSMATEVIEIFRHVMFDGEQPLSALYDDFSFVNNDLASFYGINGNFNDSFTKVEDLGDRGGILTSGAFMAGFANQNETSPITRGVFVRENLLCMHVPPMPTNLEVFREDAAAALDDFVASQGGAILNRERFHFLTKDEPCSLCHEAIINPHGFGMENFDAVGLVRTQDANNLSIDDSGELIGLSSLSDGQVESFTGARGLATVLQDLPAIQSCYVEKSFRYVMATGHDVFEEDNLQVELTEEQVDSFSCAVSRMSNAMDLENQTPREALRALGVQDVVRYRK